MSGNQTKDDNRSSESREIFEFLLAQRGQEGSRRFRIERCPDREYYPLTRSQQRLGLLEQLEPGNPALNFLLPLQLPGHVDEVLGAIGEL